MALRATICILGGRQICLPQLRGQAEPVLPIWKRLTASDPVFQQVPICLNRK